MTWNTTDSLVGEVVTIETAAGEFEPAIVVAVSTASLIKVRVEDGTILVGNQYE